MTNALSSPRTYRLLAAVEATDAVASGIPIPPIRNTLDSLGVPENIRWMLPAAKGAATIGLLSVTRFPWLARLTTLMLAVYFVLAVGAHIRVRDRVVNTIPAAAMLALCAAMTAKGPTGT